MNIFYHLEATPEAVVISLPEGRTYPHSGKHYWVQDLTFKDDEGGTLTLTLFHRNAGSILTSVGKTAEVSKQPLDL